MATVSLRKFIRWVPDEASEPTSTLVLSSPGRRFVDLRILKDEGGGEIEASKGPHVLPLDKLDWAIAGTSSTSMRDDVNGGQVAHSQFHHWIDSRTTDAVMDEGDMYPQQDGTTLEKGTMVNPDTGRDTEYEELWLDEDAAPGTRCVVLQLHNDRAGCRGMVVRVGDYCQGFLRTGERLSLERWEAKGDQGWRRTVRMGTEALPCLMLLGDVEVGVGDVLGADDEAWEVIEVV